jgi:hypothetical protein
MRHLITLTKFHQLKETTLPHLLSTASKLLDTDLDHDRDTLLEVIQGMDQLVFDEFIQKRSGKLVDVMELGILRSGVDWLNTGKPTGESFSLYHFYLPRKIYSLHVSLMSWSTKRGERKHDIGRFENSVTTYKRGPS